jgi:zinc transporter
VTLDQKPGVVFAFRFDADGRGQPMSAAECLVAEPPADGFIWVHVALGSARVRQWLRDSSGVPPPIVELLRDPEDHTRLVVMPEGLAGILADLRHWTAGPDRSMADFRFWTAERWVITGRNDPLETLEVIRKDCLAGMTVRGPAALTAVIIRRLAGSIDSLADHLQRSLDRLEMRMDEQAGIDIRRDLARLRTTAHAARRHLSIKRHAIAELASDPPAWFTDGDGARMREAFDHVAAVADELDEVELRARMQAEELAARLTETTNRNLYALSIITAIFVPPTLISGIFGMNVEGLPGVHDSSGFLWVMLGMGVTALISLGLLRFLRML